MNLTDSERIHLPGVSYTYLEQPEFEPRSLFEVLTGAYLND